jgi:hypothetical protein
MTMFDSPMPWLVAASSPRGLLACVAWRAVVPPRALRRPSRTPRTPSWEQRGRPPGIPSGAMHASPPTVLQLAPTCRGVDCCASPRRSRFTAGANNAVARAPIAWERHLRRWPPLDNCTGRRKAEHGLSADYLTSWKPIWDIPKRSARRSHPDRDGHLNSCTPCRWPNGSDKSAHVRMEDERPSCFSNSGRRTAARHDVRILDQDEERRISDASTNIARPCRGEHSRASNRTGRASQATSRPTSQGVVAVVEIDLLRSAADA